MRCSAWTGSTHTKPAQAACASGGLSPGLSASLGLTRCCKVCKPQTVREAARGQPAAAQAGDSSGIAVRTNNTETQRGQPCELTT